jgi:DNA-binding XRE family transcriptional regulator
MTGVNFTGVLSKEFAMSDAHRAILNVLMIAAYITCLIGFIPKSMDEARGILRTKWLFFMNDFFGRVRIEGDEAALARKEKKTAFWTSKLAWKNQSVWIDVHIGERIKAARNQAGMTQLELAGILGISQAQVYRLESGDNRASANQLFVLSKVLSVDMNFFTEGLETRTALKPAKS